MHTQLADWTDVGTALKRSLARVRTMRGGEATACGLIFLCIAAIDAPWCWHFDIQTTINWMGNAPAAITSSLPGSVAIIAPALVVLTYLAPTLLGIGLPPLVTAGFKFAEVAHLAVMAFDATTDFPNVQATMNALWPRFEAMGALVGTIAWYVCYGLLWAMATEGFELIFIVCVVCGLVCLRNGVGEGGKP